MTQLDQGLTGHTATVVSPAGETVTLSWSALTDTGLKRTANEDSYLAQPPIFAVADGMGGHSAGDFASAAVVTRLAEYGDRVTVEPTDITVGLRVAVEDMQEGLGITDNGTGTTVTGAALTIVNGETAWLIFNVGDSRVYLNEHGELEQLTRDDSVVQELIDGGYITPEEAEVHPQSNIITRAVGFHEDPVPEFLVRPLTVGMRLLICSDGLTKELTNYGIRHFLMANPKATDAAQQLVEAALGNGGRDNVTVIVVDVVSIVRDA